VDKKGTGCTKAQWDIPIISFPIAPSSPGTFQLFLFQMFDPVLGRLRDLESSMKILRLKRPHTTHHTDAPQKGGSTSLNSTQKNLRLRPIKTHLLPA
jgi:hypothetical protein